MPEENQIQPGFQPENQINPQIQQNNFVQNQQPIQNISQQNRKENSQQISKEESQNTKHIPLRRKILCGIFCLLSIVSIVLLILDFINGYTWRYDIYDYLLLILKITLSLSLIPAGIILNTEYKSSLLIKIFCGLFGFSGIILTIGFTGEFFEDGYYDIEECLMYSLSVLLSLGLLFIGILTYSTQKVEAYYHPSRLTKIFSGLIRFIGISLIICGLYNFLLIGSEDSSFLKILLVGGIIILCGIFFIFLGNLLYKTKKIVYLSVTFITSIIIGIFFGWVLNRLGDDILGRYDDKIKQLIIAFCLYFYIITIIQGIRCFILKKRGKFNGKFLNKELSSKKIGYITTGILFLMVIINIIYGKIQWSKIPEIDDSMFNRDYHQTKLPDEKDALVQLRNYNNGNINKVFEPLDSYYLYSLGNSYYLENNKDISWKQYPEECYVIYSGGNEYCGTWIWNKKTLDRVLNNYYYLGDNPYMEDFYDSDGYLSIDGKKVTIFEYIQKNEKEIRKVLQELDRIVSLDYYLPNDEILDLIPNYFQSQSRTSTIILSYYIYQEDWDMVMFIIKLNYKIIDIFNTSGSVLNQLISLVIQGIIDSSINSYIQLFPENLRDELSQRYSTQIYSEDEIFDKMIKGEYIMWNWAKAGNILGDVGYGDPSLSQFLFHFPFFSAKEINNLMNYLYYLFWKQKNDDNFNNITDKTIYNHSLYNRYGIYPYTTLMPRMSSLNNRINKSLYHKEALIKNLESGKYDIRFNEPDWNNDPYEYENNRIPTKTELIENKIKKYSNIINPCFGEDTITDFLDNANYIDFGYECSRSLTELKKQEDDDFGLKENLTEISQLRINYNETEEEINNCHESEDFNSNTCKKYYNEQEKNINNIKKSYIKLSDILGNIKNKFPEINIENYFYIPEIMYDIDYYPDDTELDNMELNDIELPESMNIIRKYSDIIQPCLSTDFIESYEDINYYTEFLEICSQNYIEIKKQENDNFGLKEILTEISELLINYYEIQIKMNECNEKYIGDICTILFDQLIKNSDKINKSYIKLLNILDNIKEEFPEIDIDDYFYIPEIIYENLDYLKENNTVLDNLESEDIELNKSINKIKEYSNIIQPCLGKDIIDPKYSIGYYHDEFENNCKKTLSELENQENDNFGLKEILINITRLLINYSKIEREVDICWEDEIISDICEKNFEKEEKIIKKIKENYLKLSYIFKEINNNGGLGIYIDDYIYIPYEKIYDEDNLTLIIFNIDN